MVPSSEIPIPHGPERQRVLNVLAQRRYRQRKRERLLSLEAKYAAKNSHERNFVFVNSTKEPILEPNHPIQMATPAPSVGDPPSYDMFPGDIMAGTPISSCVWLATTEPVALPNVDCWSSPAAGSENNIGVSSFDNPSAVSTRLPHEYPSVNNTFLNGLDIAAELQDLETSQSTFADESVMDIPCFKTMEASLKIANMLGLTSSLLDINSKQVLDSSKFSIPWGEVPQNLRPTPAQMSIPHHPFIDILPWPSVRTKLICIFSQPDELRPAIARGPLAIMHLAHDLDDEAEGLRVTSGKDGIYFDGSSWEIGQAIFKDWWWVLDFDIISNSNRLRNMRGAPKLQLPST